MTTSEGAPGAPQPPRKDETTVSEPHVCEPGVGEMLGACTICGEFMMHVAPRRPTPKSR